MMDNSAFSNSSCGKTHFCFNSETGKTRNKIASFNSLDESCLTLIKLQNAIDCSPLTGLVYALETLIDVPIS